MSLKFEVDTVEGLDAPIAGLYEKTEGGKYRLKVEGIEDTTGLKRQRDELLSEKKAAAQRAKEAEEAARIAAEEAARKSGDVSALEKSWQEKYAKGIGEKDSELSALRGSLNKMLVDNVAVSLANELAVQGSAAILIPHIKARLDVDTSGGEPKTIVLGADGKRSALTIDELKAEIAANQAFAPVLAGSKATGGGASGTGAGGGAAKTVTRAQFEQMSAGQQMEHIRSGGKVN